MKHLLLYSIMLCLLLVACEKVETLSDSNQKFDSQSEFLATHPGYSLGLVAQRSTSLMAQNTSDDMALSIQEKDWVAEKVPMSRITETGDELVWIMDAPLISLYLANTDGTLLKGNVPYNAATKKIYYDWHSIKPGFEEQTGTTRPDLVQNVDSKSEFFWDTWNQRPTTMPDEVDFYGFYPRPSGGGTVSDNLYLLPTSIVDRKSATNTEDGWNKLNFTFYPAGQNYDNLSDHDIMYAVPERNDEHEHRHGSLNKTKNDNIQMHFEHAFCMLDITVNRGNYPMNANGTISRITVAGEEVYTAGQINIGKLGANEQRIIPTSKNGKIERFISTKERMKAYPFHATMIMPPCTVTKGDTKALNITCVVDGRNYTCPIYSDEKDLVFQPGKQYSLNLTLAPSGIVMFRIWAGGEVKLENGTTYEKEQYVEGLTFGEKYPFTIDIDESKYKLLGVMENGVPLTEYQLEPEEGKNLFYDVVVVPKDNWYITDGLRLHFDGLQHDKCYHGSMEEQQKSLNTGIWSDLSGYAHDGSLNAFDFNENSGWTSDGKGLKFDGDNDIVTFRGDVNAKEYTMSFYMYMDETQKDRTDRSHYRLNAEGRYYPAFYIHTNEHYQLGLYGHDVDTSLGVPSNGANDNSGYYTPLGKKTAQFDFVYKGNDEDGIKKIYVYVNGLLQTLKNGKGYFEVEQDAGSVEVASLGGRVEDNSRSLKGIYYSYMLYNRALKKEEIQHNYNVNLRRYK